MTDLLSFLTWWLAVTAFGLLAWPIQFRLLRFLPDRGYSLTKTAGLLTVGYAGWLLGNFGFTRVDNGGVVAAAMVVGAVSLIALRHQTEEMRSWWGRSRWAVLAVEVLFLAAFGLWAYARAFNPSITATEKPMEFGFLNSVLRTGTQPPGDPWLAGYAISYYHFGYVIMGMLTAVTGVLPSVAFNLGIALLFALTATGAFGIVLNLIAAASDIERRRKTTREPGHWGLNVAILPALIAPVFMLMGNFNGALEVAHHSNLFAVNADQGAQIAACPPERRLCIQCVADNADPAQNEACRNFNPLANLWTWIDIKYTNVPPQIDPQAASGSDSSLVSSRHLWWWQSSRVIHDRNLSGDEVEVIDEFPFFSFLLGDMHPHVLGLPFVFLAIGFGLNLFLTVQADAEVKTEPFDRAQPWTSLPRLLPLAWPDLLWGAVIVGGLSFLNTWDFPIYVFVIVGAYTAARAMRDGWDNPVWRDAGVLAASLVVAGVVLYLPFYIGFRSQLGGVLPNLIFGTRLPQFLVMFGPSLSIVLVLIGWLAANRARHIEWQSGTWVGGAVLLSLILLAVLMPAGALALFGDQPDVQAAISAVIGSASLQEAAGLILRRRLEIERLLTPLLITFVLTAGAALVLGARRARPAADGAPAESNSKSARPPVPMMPFVAILIITGALLTLGPEFVYLRDLFSTRMNTIFKFYYQAWVVWSLAAAFGTWALFRYASPIGQALFGVGASIVVILGLFYPFLATATITENWQGTTRNAEDVQYATLDGMAYMERVRPADYAAVNFLNRTVTGRPVIVEAVGGSYTEFARVSAHTGLPTIVGWGFHEVQWRSGSFDPEVRTRDEAVRTIYTSNSWEETQPLLDQYDVRYVYIGPMEFGQYNPIAFEKFDRNLSKIYEANDVIIYEYRGGS